MLAGVSSLAVAARQAAPAGATVSLADALAALETAGKLVCAWFLPADDPDQYLTLNGAAVEGWAAAYGTQKVDLAELTNPPAWDASLFGGKGGVVFDGTNDCLTGTGSVTAWPANTDDLYMLAAVRNDDVGFRSAFAYGDGSTTQRIIRIANGTANISGLAGTNGFTGATTPPAATLTIGAHWDVGGTSTGYLNGVSDATVATAAPALTRTRVRLGASAAGASASFWFGAISCAAILNSTATLTDFTDLEALMRARLA